MKKKKIKAELGKQKLVKVHKSHAKVLSDRNALNNTMLLLPDNYVLCLFRSQFLLLLILIILHKLIM